MINKIFLSFSIRVTSNIQVITDYSEYFDLLWIMLDKTLERNWIKQCFYFYNAF